MSRVVRATLTVEVVDAEGGQEFLVSTTDKVETSPGWGVNASAGNAIQAATLTVEMLVKKAFGYGDE